MGCVERDPTGAIKRGADSRDGLSDHGDVPGNDELAYQYR